MILHPHSHSTAPLQSGQLEAALKHLEQSESKIPDKQYVKEKKGRLPPEDFPELVLTPPESLSAYEAWKTGRGDNRIQSSH